MSELGGVDRNLKRVGDVPPAPSGGLTKIGEVPVATPKLKKVGEVPVVWRDFWAEDYNADAKIPMEERLSHFEKAQDIKVTKQVEDSADYAVNSGAFDNELKSLGLDKKDLIKGLIDISKVESGGGNLPKEKQVSSGMAQGLWQLIEPSARSVLNNGQFGKKAANASGIPLEELKAMSKEELRDVLLNNDNLNALFAAALVVQKFQHKRNKGSGS